MPTLEKIREQAQYDPGTIFVVGQGYYDLLQMALAREDRTTIDTVASFLARLFSADKAKASRSLLSALLEDDLQKIDFNFLSLEEGMSIRILTFCNEHGMQMPESLIAKIDENHSRMDAFTRYREIAYALTSGDNARLSQAIDDAEAHHLVVHAARMRIVLVQRTKDRAQLAQVRSVLEQLGDRQYLRKLSEVEVTLG